jgi:hypothetical protein
VGVGSLHILIDSLHQFLDAAKGPATNGPLRNAVEQNLQLPAVEMIIAQGIDPAKVVASTELAVSGTVVSSNLTYLAPTVEVAEVSDNYFDMLPGQSVEIMIKTKANEEALRKGLKVISLVDAFNDSLDRTDRPELGQVMPALRISDRLSRLGLGLGPRRTSRRTTKESDIRSGN